MPFVLPECWLWSVDCSQYAQRNSEQPTVNPAPTAAASTRSPFLRRPCSRAVSIARGIVPAVVLPYSSILIMTRSSFSPKRSAADIMMRRLAWWGTNSATSELLRPLRSKIASDASAILRTAYLKTRSEEHTSELQSLTNLVCRLLLEKKKNKQIT